MLTNSATISKNIRRLVRNTFETVNKFDVRTFLIDLDASSEDRSGITTKFFKSYEIRWAVQNIEHFISREKDGTTVIESWDKEACVKILPNSHIIEVEHDVLLRGGKPLWIENNKEEILNENKDYLNTISTRYNPHQKSSFRDTGKVFKMAYEYRRIKKKFHIGCVPSPFLLPIILLARLGYIDSYYFLWRSPLMQAIYSIFDFLNPYSDVLLDEGTVEVLKKEGMTLVGKDFLVVDMERHMVDLGREEKDVKTQGLWGSDSISPSVDPFAHRDTVQYMLCDSGCGILWRLQLQENQSAMWLPETNRFIITNQEAKFFRIEVGNSSEREQEIVFDISLVPNFLRPAEPNPRKAKRLIDTMATCAAHSKKFQKEEKVEVRTEAKEEDSNIELIDSLQTDYGKLQLYSNKSLSLRFHDRTILRIGVNNSQIRIITPTGEIHTVPLEAVPECFHQHVLIGQKLLFHYFEDDETKAKEYEMQTMCAQVIEDALSKNKRFLSYLEGRPGELTHGLKSQAFIHPEMTGNVEMDLAILDQLERNRKLLDSLNKICLLYTSPSPRDS
eukprot:TRINITY_DN9241_c0_g1_i7.p1 TRINITY_DN9241_c0_g1~~TRINITY_DN9241_c0_g1_i7.p1  ORF type:complete len:559 (+),score=129.27 TRINITY_DN9241_c0_g1_i7:292-1968(+)